jgi:hypothetical protein
MMSASVESLDFVNARLAEALPQFFYFFARQHNLFVPCRTPRHSGTDFIAFVLVSP